MTLYCAFRVLHYALGLRCLQIAICQVSHWFQPQYDAVVVEGIVTVTVAREQIEGSMGRLPYLHHNSCRLQLQVTHSHHHKHTCTCTQTLVMYQLTIQIHVHHTPWSHCKEERQSQHLQTRTTQSKKSLSLSQTHTHIHTHTHAQVVELQETLKEAIQEHHIESLAANTKHKLETPTQKTGQQTLGCEARHYIRHCAELKEEVK